MARRAILTAAQRAALLALPTERRDLAGVWTLSEPELAFGIFAAIAEFERELIVERTKAGLAAARARGRRGGRPYKMTPAKLRLAMVAMADVETNVGELCRELGVARQTLYRHVDPGGALREDGRRLLASRGRGPGSAAA